jgi:hypothetical protein
MNVITRLTLLLQIFKDNISIEAADPSGRAV